MAWQGWRNREEIEKMRAIAQIAIQQRAGQLGALPSGGQQQQGGGSVRPPVGRQSRMGQTMGAQEQQPPLPVVDAAKDQEVPKVEEPGIMDTIKSLFGGGGEDAGIDIGSMADLGLGGPNEDMGGGITADMGYAAETQPLPEVQPQPELTPLSTGNGENMFQGAFGPDVNPQDMPGNGTVMPDLRQLQNPNIPEPRNPLEGSFGPDVNPENLPGGKKPGNFSSVGALGTHMKDQVGRIGSDARSAMDNLGSKINSAFGIDPSKNTTEEVPEVRTPESQRGDGRGYVEDLGHKFEDLVGIPQHARGDVNKKTEELGATSLTDRLGKQSGQKLPGTTDPAKVVGKQVGTTPSEKGPVPVTTTSPQAGGTTRGTSSSKPKGKWGKLSAAMGNPTGDGAGLNDWMQDAFGDSMSGPSMGHMRGSKADHVQRGVNKINQTVGTDLIPEDFASPSKGKGKVLKNSKLEELGKTMGFGDTKAANGLSKFDNVRLRLAMALKEIGTGKSDPTLDKLIFGTQSKKAQLQEKNLELRNKKLVKGLNKPAVSKGPQATGKHFTYATHTAAKGQRDHDVDLSKGLTSRNRASFDKNLKDRIPVDLANTQDVELAKKKLATELTQMYPTLSDTKKAAILTYYEKQFEAALDKAG